MPALEIRVLVPLRVYPDPSRRAVVAMAPMRDDALVLVAASKAMPLGLVHRVLDRCVARASEWLGKGAA